MSSERLASASSSSASSSASSATSSVSGGRRGRQRRRRGGSGASSAHSSVAHSSSSMRLSQQQQSQSLAASASAAGANAAPSNSDRVVHIGDGAQAEPLLHISSEDVNCLELAGLVERGSVWAAAARQPSLACVHKHLLPCPHPDTCEYMCVNIRPPTHTSLGGAAHRRWIAQAGRVGLPAWGCWHGLMSTAGNVLLRCTRQRRLPSFEQSACSAAPAARPGLLWSPRGLSVAPCEAHRTSTPKFVFIGHPLLIPCSAPYPPVTGGLVLCTGRSGAGARWP